MKHFKWIYLFGFLCSCAQPKYLSQPSARASTSQGSEHKPELCQAKFKSQICVNLLWEKMPTESDFGSFVVKIFRANHFDASSVPEDLDHLSVLLWMPAMGHGSSPPTIERLDIGTYRVSKVFFIMRGDWEIHFQIKDASKSSGETQDEAIFNIRF